MRPTGVPGSLGPPLESVRAPPVVAVARPRRWWPPVWRRAWVRSSPASALRRLTPASLPSDPAQPLVLHMHSITPDYIPDQGPIVIHGTITNASNEEWTAINVHGFIGSAPLTTSAELAAAARDAGRRRRRRTGSPRPARSTRSRSSSPGQTKSFTVHLPRSQLQVSAPGRLLVRRPRPGRDRRGTQRQCRRTGPHLPSSRAPVRHRVGRAGGHRDRRTDPGRRHPCLRRLDRATRRVARQPAVRRSARRGVRRTCSAGPPADLGRRPRRA